MHSLRGTWFQCGADSGACGAAAARRIHVLRLRRPYCRQSYKKSIEIARSQSSSGLRHRGERATALSCHIPAAPTNVHDQCALICAHVALCHVSRDSSSYFGAVSRSMCWPVRVRPEGAYLLFLNCDHSEFKQSTFICAIMSNLCCHARAFSHARKMNACVFNTNKLGIVHKFLLTIKHHIPSYM